MRKFNWTIFWSMLALASMIFTACAPASTVTVDEPQNIVASAPATTEPVSLAKANVPFEAVGDVFIPNPALLNGQDWASACANGECVKTVNGSFVYVRGHGWIWEAQWKVIKGQTTIATQMATSTYPEDPETGLVYWPAEKEGDDNIAMTVSQFAAKLVVEAEKADQNAGDDDENRVVKLGDDETTFANAKTSKDGRVCVLKKNGNLAWVNAIAAAQRPMENNSLSTDCTVDTEVEDDDVTEEVAIITNPGKTTIEGRAEDAFDVCLTNGQPKKCQDAGISPLPDGSTVESDSNGNHNGWEKYVDPNVELPNNHWSRTFNTDGSVTVCNKSVCQTFWPVIVTTNPEPTGNATPTLAVSTPTASADATVEPTAQPNIIPTATADPFTNPAETNCPGGSCESNGVPGGFNPPGHVNTPVPENDSVATPAPEVCYNPQGHVISCGNSKNK